MHTLLSLYVAEFSDASSAKTTEFLPHAWVVPEDRQQEETTHSPKNAVMAGGALVVAVLAGEPWAFSAGVGLF